MKTGWLELGGKHYWLDASGRMATGARYIDGYRRYFWTNGECDKIGWQNPSQYPPGKLLDGEAAELLHRSLWLCDALPHWR